MDPGLSCISQNANAVDMGKEQTVGYINSPNVCFQEIANFLPQCI